MRLLLFLHALAALAYDLSRPVYGEHRGRVGLVRPWGWRDFIGGIAGSWRWAGENKHDGWWHLNHPGRDLRNGIV